MAYFVLLPFPKHLPKEEAKRLGGIRIVVGHQYTQTFIPLGQGGHRELFSCPRNAAKRQSDAEGSSKHLAAVRPITSLNLGLSLGLSITMYRAFDENTAMPYIGFDVHCC